ncbi:hypothetical protein AMD27_11265 [Acinetobacter sp. TGL-Y2]|uniref:hypothetical protein n=1 Tax=Acinetobacter sp. TGL-Y2 TaxID=1407071 RepID=UPI0007A6742B|nr:hypothetical protein [Acinetobacter sp. TGL-Y2]AMW79411.1 hypothetical protein AMD27_11265 [Acinetobacter sp. TGL-Y2]
MKEQLKIAIFGLSLNILEHIKQEIQSIYPDIHIAWVNISDPALDVLLVNEIFFNADSIQHIVNAKHVPYLRLITAHEKAGSIADDILYLPFQMTDQIREWFKIHLTYTSTDKTERLTRAPYKKADVDKVIQEFLNERNDNIQIFDASGNIGLMNTRTEQVWLDPERKLKGTDSSINYTYATMQMAQSVIHTQGMDLRIWLWNTLWYSNELLKSHSSTDFYKLVFWPQPDPIADRREIFQIAACFEKGANIQQVEQNLEVSQDRIMKFVSVALMCGALCEISIDEAHLVQDDADEAPSGLGRFFLKIRSKLGLGS